MTIFETIKHLIMKFNIYALLCIGIFLFSCEKESLPIDQVDQPVNLVTETLMTSLFAEGEHWSNSSFNFAKKKHAVTKILKIRTSGTMTMTPDSPECNGNILVNVEGEGNASHLGKFTITLDYCSDGVAPVSPILATQTAANGDQLYSVVVGSDPSKGSLDFMYYDGTGRFEGASGFITLFFTFDYVNQTFSNYGEGTLTY